MRDLEGPLAAVKGRWMAGLSGAEAAPAAWRDLVGDGAEAELRLLALVGQAGEVGWVPTAKTISMMPPMPTLALPPMPELARTRFRQFLTIRKPAAAEIGTVLRLAEARGWCVHPADWMPAASDTQAPALYAPWIDWLGATAERDGAGEALTEETWDLFMPAERRTALAALRRSDPRTLRALLTAKAAGIPADERLRLFALLEDGLEEADIPLLESLDTDRSAKVRALAARLLARIGAAAPGSADVGELAAMLEMTRLKLFGSAKGLGPRKLKTDAQKTRRGELMRQVPLHALAAAFGLSPEETVCGWRIEADRDATLHFAMMVAETGQDAVIAPLARRLLDAERVLEVSELVPRLSSGTREALALDALRLEGDHLALAADLMGERPGTMPLDALAGAPDVWAALRDRGSEGRDGERIGAILGTLGLLADRQAARALLDRFVGAGMMLADPRLTMLHLNASLPAPHDTTAH